VADSYEVVGTPEGGTVIPLTSDPRPPEVGAAAPAVELLLPTPIPEEDPSYQLLLSKTSAEYPQSDYPGRCLWVVSREEGTARLWVGPAPR
jgi:hypothetical protein